MQTNTWMEEDRETADLVLVLGTSLGGLYADKVATVTAHRSLFLPVSAGTVIGARIQTRAVRRDGERGEYPECEGLIVGVDEAGALSVKFERWPASLGGPDQIVTLAAGHPVEVLSGGSLGAVCINLQQTPQDGCMSLRLFAKSDDVLRLLLVELGIGPIQGRPCAFAKTCRVLVPYDSDGRRLAHGVNRRMWLDLNNGQMVRVSPGHNIQGARQPQYLHIGASKAKTYLGVTRQPAAGLGTVTRRDERECCFVLCIEGVEMRLGLWWVDAAVRGAVVSLPIVNQDPSFQDE